MIAAPRAMVKVGLETMCHSAQIMGQLAPTEATRGSWVELLNKLDAFTCFSYADQFDLTTLDPYRRLWVTEGHGYMRAESALHGRILDSDLIPLHTGMGLAFACRAMKTNATTREKIGIFLELCDRHALDGYGGACYEALGLVVRNLYPESVAPCLENLTEELRQYFWHGVGRGIYFIPTNLSPLTSAPWRPARMAKREPPDETGRLNAIAGLVWAVTLVNIRNPEILDLFRRHHGSELPVSACQDGICSAMQVWESSQSSSDAWDYGSPGEWFRFENNRNGWAKH